jgi:hypothetical protein
MSYYPRFFQRIADYIDREGITPEEACMRMQISPKKLRAYEDNETFPQPIILKGVCERMGWSYDEVLREIIDDIQVLYIPSAALALTSPYRKELDPSAVVVRRMKDPKPEEILREVFKSRSVFESSNEVKIDGEYIYISTRILRLKYVKGLRGVRRTVVPVKWCDGTTGYSVAIKMVDLMLILKG